MRKEINGEKKVKYQSSNGVAKLKRLRHSRKIISSEKFTNTLKDVQSNQIEKYSITALITLRFFTYIFFRQLD